jgi:hypothetical protein
LIESCWPSTSPLDISIRHFRFMLEGRSFTDHKPLLGSLNCVSVSLVCAATPPAHIHRRIRCQPQPHLGSRQYSCRHSLPTTAGWASSSCRRGARTVSRDIAADQSGCLGCQRAANSPALRVATATLDGVPLLVYTSSAVFRPLVPSAHRRLSRPQRQPSQHQGDEEADLQLVHVA